MAAATAAAGGEAGFGCPSSAACDEDCASSSRLCLDKAGTVAERVKKKEKASKDARVEDHREQGAGCADDWWAKRWPDADMAVEYLLEQGGGCADDWWAERRRKPDMAEYLCEQGAAEYGDGDGDDESEELEPGDGDGDDESEELESSDGDGDDESEELEPLFFDEAAAVAEHGDAECADLEPLFFDEAAAVAEHEKRMPIEKLRREEEARNRKLIRARQAALNRIREYDPKKKKTYFARLEYVDDIATFDHDEESPLGPMRYTNASIYAHDTVRDGSTNILASDGEKLNTSDSANLRSIKISYLSSDVDGDNRPFVPEDSANVFSIKIVSSDVGFPIDVYGTVIARDNIDLKCVYLFRRDRDHSQFILSKDESLILTGPKRGLALKYYMYFEFDLKIKCVGKGKDKQLSKGYLALNALNYRWWQEMEVESKTLDTQLSKVMITYAVVHTAVEATFAIEVLQGRFYGEITACTTGIRDSIVLHDSKMFEAMTNSGKGVIQLLRNVVAVDMREKLILSIVARAVDGKVKSTTIRFTPGLTGVEEKEITCGSIKMCVKITWSIISRRLIPI